VVVFMCEATIIHQAFVVGYRGVLVTQAVSLRRGLSGLNRRKLTACVTSLSIPQDIFFKLA